MTLSPDEISQLVDGMEKEVKSIKNDTLKMIWYMRGGLSYTEAMNLGMEERTITIESRTSCTIN